MAKFAARALAVAAAAMSHPSAGHALDREASAALVFEVQQARDQEALAALSVLQGKGYLAERTDEGAAPRAPGRMSEGDVVVSFGQVLLDRAMETELFRNALPPQLSELRLALEGSEVVIAGRLDGPLFMDPAFRTRVRLVGVGLNAFEIRVASIKVAGLEIKRLCALFHRVVEATLKDGVGAFASIEDRGLQPDGSYVLRVEAHPECFVPRTFPTAAPMLRGWALADVEVADGQVRYFLSCEQ